jgi:anthranilate phosphoribosyltransferase
MQDVLESLRALRDLDASRAAALATALLADDLDDAAKAECLRLLAAKGESVGEIEAFARVFLEHAVDPGLREEDLPGPALDIVGTGGDRLDLFNVSTTAMFVLAGGGVCVVKHGNRAVTSKSGGADVLEALGVRIDLPPARFADCVKECGCGFLFAPLYHPAFKAIAPVRRQLAAEGVRTVFNLLGPLLNPARPSRQLIGVCEAALGPVFAVQMERLGRRTAWIVHGLTTDGRGMDELSTLADSTVWAWDRESGHAEFALDPRPLDFHGGDLADLRGGDATANAAITRGLLDGTLRDIRRRMVVWNAAGGFVAAGLAADIEEGIDRARESIDSGAAEEALRRLAAFQE